MNPYRKTILTSMGVAALVLTAVALPDLAAAQQGTGAQPPVTKDDVLAACNVDRHTQLFFGIGSPDKIWDLETAIRVRMDAQRTRKDRLSEQVRDYQGLLTRMRPSEKHEQECVRRYVALLRSFDTASLELARARAEQESADRIEQQRQTRTAKQAAYDEAAAEQARRQKEAETIAAQAAEERRQREAAAAAAALERQKEETARAIVEAAEQKKAAETATAIAELKRTQEAAKAEAAEAVLKQQAAERAAWEAKRQAEAAEREERERPAREAAAKAAQEAEAAARREAEKLPACTDTAILETVKKVVAASPMGQIMGLRVFGFEQLRNVDLDTAPPKRFCAATMLTTAGTLRGSYNFRRTEAHDGILVEVILDE